jgi:hypothetical protein
MGTQEGTPPHGDGTVHPAGQFGGSMGRGRSGS